MLKYLISFLLISLLLFSCEKKLPKKIAQKKVAKPTLSIKVTHQPIYPIKKEFLKELESWEEYQTLQNFISQFQKTSPNEALSNALELRDLSKNLKDSVPSLLNNNAFKARLNVLYNETLRLADMTYISAIKPIEVNNQVSKILEVYNALNIKINTFFTQKKFENEIDFNVVYIGIDTTKIDSVSKIDLRKKELIRKDILNRKNIKNKKVFRTLDAFDLKNKKE